MGLHGGPPKGLMLELKRSFSIENFIETGTFRGDTSAWAAREFRSVVTIEGSPELHAAAERRHAALTNVRFVQGDTRTVLGGVVEALTGPALVWIDSHWSGGPTYGEGDECPLLFEIETLRASPHEHFLFIDDARLFLAPPPRPHRMEQWPGIAEVVEALTRGPRPLGVLLLDDTVIAVPQKAWSLTRTYAQDAATREWERRQSEAQLSDARRGARLLREGVELLGGKAGKRLASFLGPRLGGRFGRVPAGETDR